MALDALPGGGSGMSAGLAVEGLAVSLPTERGPARVVREVSFDLPPGGTLGLVGESGCGKTMTALAIMGLLPGGARAEGQIRLGGEDLVTASEPRLCALRGDRMAMIFQEPMTSLNPVHRVGDQVAEGLRLHRGMGSAEALAEAARLVDRVRIPHPRARLKSYPHELSGGQRQRVMIALALACKPDLLIADEPTSALDVTVQAQLLDLLAELIADLGMALLLISHDLAVVGRLCRRVAVMYAGTIVDQGPTEAVYRTRAHPYTEGLFAALPGGGRVGGRVGGRGGRLAAIPGIVPTAFERPPGCAFHGRCGRGDARCHATPPPRAAIGVGHSVDCFHPGGAS